MGFYDEFSQYYDYIFPLKEEKIEFLLDVFSRKRCKKILDVGAATATYAIELSKNDFIVTAIDIDNTMIELARKKAEMAKSNLELKLMDMLDIDKTFSNNTFGGIYSIGNVLVHLPSLEDIKLFIKKTTKILKKEGTLVIQIINYDRILNNDLKGLKTIKADNNNLFFIRNYKFEDKEKNIIFDTELKIKKEEAGFQIFKNKTSLIPLKTEQLYQFLKEAGYNKINFYGDFYKNDYNIDNSIPCIVVASF